MWRFFAYWWRLIVEWLGRHFRSSEPKDEERASLAPDELPTGELDLQDDWELISPPILAAPLYACAEVLVVLSFLPHAELEFEIDGATFTRTGGFPEPDGQPFALPDPLEAGWQVRARQHHDGRSSAWTALFTVRDHTVDYPAGPPRPQINPAPVHECGSRTGVSNLLTGCTVYIEGNGIERGRVNGAKEHQGVNVDPDYGTEDVQAFASLCDDRSAGSALHPTQPPPSPLGEPAIDTNYENQEQIRVVNLANGARFNIVHNGTDLGWWRTWGGAHFVALGPLGAGDTVEIKQRMCPGDPDSPTGSSTTQPCSALPAPKAGPVQDGDQNIVITEQVPGAVVKIYGGDLVKIGEGTGPVIALVRPVAHNETLYLTQSLGDCTSSTTRTVDGGCVNPRWRADPAALDLFPVGNTTYDGGTFTVDGDTYSIRGTVFYPAEADGVDQDFAARLAVLGPVPIVFTAHGNHRTWRDPANHLNESCGPSAGFEEIPNHEGYEYFQRALAKMGFIAVGVYSNETNCKDYTVKNMRHRAEVIQASIEHFSTLSSAGDAIFGGVVDLDRIGLMGHSRGGEAVVTLPEIISVVGANIRSVISLAPTNAGASSGRPDGYDLMVILPAADGDVRTNPGAIYYDQATPSSFRSQLYIDGANHNYFNRQWPQDDGLGPDRPSRNQHERILASYGSAFFRATLMGHDTHSYLFGGARPSGVITDPVHLSFGWRERIIVDNHQQPNGIGENSLLGSTDQLNGLIAEEVDHVQTNYYGTCVPGESTYYGRTTRMEAWAQEANGEFRSELDRPYSVVGSEIWIRAAEVHDPPDPPPDNMSFDLGVEWSSGSVSWVNSEEVGGVPAIYSRSDCGDKTMFTTLRFPGGCFPDRPREDDVIAIRLRLSGAHGERKLACDDLEIVAVS
ncbi:MAG: hypothetical protein ACFCVK_19675 [Acidimicrobiales bacterium]